VVVVVVGRRATARGEEIGTEQEEEETRLGLGWLPTKKSSLYSYSLAWSGGPTNQPLPNPKNTYHNSLPCC
jgi:hypothetical protein